MYSLQLCDPPLSGISPFGDYTVPFAPTWRRSIARHGGFKIGTVDLTAKEMTPGEMADFFKYGMMREIVEIGGGQLTWQGFVSAMEWQHKGDSYSLDMTKMANARRAMYRRLFDNMLTNGSAETGAWTVYNGPSNVTSVQSTAWVTDGVYSDLITVTDTGIRGARITGAGYGLTIVADKAYTIVVRLKVVAGSWRVSVNRSDTDASLAYYSTNAALGEVVVNLSIADSNTYAGTCDFRITSEAAVGSIYADGAIFREADQEADTGWQTDADSILVYGRKEQIDLWGGLSYQAANGRVASDLRYNAWPKMDVPSQNSTRRLLVDPKEDKLHVTFSGYWATLNWIYSTLTGSGQSSTLVRALAALQSAYIVPGVIEANPTTYTIEDSTPLRVGDVLKEIADAGTDVGSKWGVGVYAGRRLDYVQILPELSYHIAGGKLWNVSGGEMEPWLAQPGWAQVDDMPLGPGAIGVHFEYSGMGIGEPIGGTLEPGPSWRFLEEIEMLPDGTLNYSREEAR